jgi:hypothetical protein
MDLRAPKIRRSEGFPEQGLQRSSELHCRATKLLDRLRIGGPNVLKALLPPEESLVREGPRPHAALKLFDRERRFTGKGFAIPLLRRMLRHPLQCVHFVLQIPLVHAAS